MYDLILSGGTLVNSRGRLQADIAVKDGKIAAIGNDVDRHSTKEVLNAS
ncbi:MAG: hypothetical protein SVP52_06475 [Chloroflexota bacterium]|nr:hypothetical protein [Chloroflexota bacterium]